MRAIAVNDWGGRDALELLEVEPPPVAPDGVLVRVRAASLNPVDYKVREGNLAGAFPFHFPVIIGWGAAGGARRGRRAGEGGGRAGRPGRDVVQAGRPGLRLLPPARARIRHLRGVHDRARGV